MTPFLAVFLSPHVDGAVAEATQTDFPEEVQTGPVLYIATPKVDPDPKCLSSKIS